MTPMLDILISGARKELTWPKTRTSCIANQQSPASSRRCWLTVQKAPSPLPNPPQVYLQPAPWPPRHLATLGQAADAFSGLHSLTTRVQISSARGPKLLPDHGRAAEPHTQTTVHSGMGQSIAELGGRSSFQQFLLHSVELLCPDIVAHSTCSILIPLHILSIIITHNISLLTFLSITACV